MNVNYMSINDGTRVLDNPDRLSLLDHQFNYVIPVIVVVYLLSILFIGLDSTCNALYEFKTYTKVIMLCAGIVQFLAVTYQLYNIFALLRNIFLTDKQKISLIKLHAANAILSLLSGTSHLLTYTQEYGGICHDALGYGLHCFLRFTFTSFVDLWRLLIIVILSCRFLGYIQERLNGASGSPWFHLWLTCHVQSNGRQNWDGKIQSLCS